MCTRKCNQSRCRLLGFIRAALMLARRVCFHLVHQATPRRATPNKNNSSDDLFRLKPDCIRIYLAIVEKARQSRLIGLKLMFSMQTELNSVTEEIVRNLSYLFLGHLPRRPNLIGRGIVIGAGGTKYFANAWICIGMLRRCGCKLPIQVWHWDEGDFDSSMRTLLTSVGVETRMVPEGKKSFAAKCLSKQDLRILAALESPYKEVLVLDADNVSITNPEPLFDSPDFLRTGAILWPSRRNVDGLNLDKFSIRRRPPIEAVELDLGQMMMNKEMCWDVLNLGLWYSRYSEFFYPIVGGLQGILQLAFLNARQEFCFPSTVAVELTSTLCHHDFAGNRLFQHRKGAKWEFYGENPRIEGFICEQNCFDLLSELKAKWAGKGRSVPFDLSGKSSQVKKMASIISTGLFEYRRIGYGDRNITFLPNGNIGVGSAACELFWDIYQEAEDVCLEIASEEEKTCVLRRRSNGIWYGQWLHHEKMPVELVPIKTTLPRNHLQRIVFSANINGYTGYGLHAYEIFNGLESYHYDVVVRPLSIDEKFAPIPTDVSEKLVTGIQNDEWEFILQTPPDFSALPGKRTVLFTMWESTQLPPHFVSRLNQADHIIVPCQWNKKCLELSGVSKPIHIVPLGIREDVFRSSPINMVGPCIFGTAGRTEGGGIRKGIDNVIRAFKKAFPVESDVQMLVKCFPDCDILKPNDDRVKIVQAFLTETELAQWFHSLTCFVSGAKGEGWGLMQHQAMACGRPIISVAFGGVTEFFDEKVGYPIKFNLIPAQGRYEGCGEWAEPDEKQLIKSMRRVYKKREEARQLGKLSARRVKALTWKNSSREMVDILRNIGVLN